MVLSTVPSPKSQAYVSGVVPVDVSVKLTVSGAVPDWTSEMNPAVGATGTGSSL